MKHRLFLFFCIVTLACVPFALRGAVSSNADVLSPKNVVILANSNEPESVALAQYYAGKRAIPEANIVALPMPSAEALPWDGYIRFIEEPLHAWLLRNGWLVEDMPFKDVFGRTHGIVLENRVGYLVTCQGVPLKIADEPRFDTPANRSDFMFALHVKNGTPMGELLLHSSSSVDSELAAMLADVNPVLGFIPNPLYGKRSFGGVATLRVIRTSRLGGSDYAAARSLVDSALEGEKNGLSGRVYIDEGGPFLVAERWLQSAAALFRASGWDVDEDTGRATFGPEARFDAPAVYLGWYATAVNGPFLEPGMRFPSGAIAAHLYSFSASTLKDRSFWCAALIDRGVAGTVGNVNEPGLEMTHNFGIMARAMIEGRSFCDAAWSSMPVLSWQGVIFGDPLYIPLPQKDGASAKPSGEYGTLAGILALEEKGDREGALAEAKKAADASVGWAVSYEYAKLLHAAGRDAEAADALTYMAGAVRLSAERRSIAFDAAGLLGSAGRYAEALAILNNLRIQDGSDAFRKAVAARGADIAVKSGRAEFIARWPKDEAPAK
jgi:uncharacterized protein (TIGR03790 family)